MIDPALLKVAKQVQWEIDQLPRTASGAPLMAGHLRRIRDAIPQSVWDNLYTATDAPQEARHEQYTRTVRVIRDKGNIVGFED